MKELEIYLSTCETYNHWKNIKIKHHHGFCTPLFSITSKNSSGIGEYTDLIPLIDWCSEIKMDVIQLLPINECYYKDPSPYNAISSCALDPIYIGLHKLPYIENSYLKKELLSFKKYNETKKVKHNIVRKKKFLWLKQYFDHFFYKHFYNLEDYDYFKSEHAFLEPYSVFRTLKEKLKGKKWLTWNENLKNITKEKLKILSEKFPKETEFYIFLQYLCFKQMKEAKSYATENQVLLKGDIPILINPDSEDVWYQRDIFDMTHVAGAPPDDFNEGGHKWGFPLFNWKRLKSRNYDFWKDRLNTIKDIYHIYRIDHAVGFFRIWAMLPKEKATHGKFLPKDPGTWRDLGEEHLKMMIHSSELFPIAEDLGFIPKFVYSSLRSLGICGTKVPRWESKNLKDYDPISLTTLSTHDTETLELWWKNHPEDAKKLSIINNWNYEKKLSFDLRKKILYDTHHSGSLFHINLLQEYFALFPDLVWKNPQLERINRSGVLSKKNWVYKFRKKIEDFTSREDLKEVMKWIIN